MKIKVLNSDNSELDLKPEEAKILTSEYMREVNQGISFRILQREAQFRPSFEDINKKMR